MIYKYQYTSEDEKSSLIIKHDNLYCIGEEHLIEGDFVIFSEEKPITQPILEERVNSLETDNLVTLEALAEVYEMMLTMQP